MNAAGTITEAMHQAQREAALGKARAQKRQIRRERKILMSRSIGTARGAAGMNRFAMECLGAGLCAVSRVREPAPRKGATFPGKPRNPDEQPYAHVVYLPQKA